MINHGYLPQLAKIGYTGKNFDPLVIMSDNFSVGFAPDHIANQQMRTLLYYLDSKQTPPFAVLGWQALQKIPFDQPQLADKAIVALCQQLRARGQGVEQIAERTGGAALLLALAAYLGQRVADDCEVPIAWYRRATLAQPPYLSQLPETWALPAQFEYSVVACVGGALCQPLAVLAQLLAGKGGLDSNINNRLDDHLVQNPIEAFYHTTRQAVMTAQRIDLNQDANAIAEQYMHQLTTGKCWQALPTFAETLQTLTFDGSAASLARLDAAWAALRAKVEPQDVGLWQALPEFQVLVYALGFYIGATSARLAGQVYKWADYAEVSALLADADFRQTLAHSFVMLTPEDLYTPLSVVIGQLFAVVGTQTAQDFANNMAKETSVPLAILTPSSAQMGQNLPAHWQVAAYATAQCIAQACQTLQNQQPLAPTLVEMPNVSPTCAAQTITLALPIANTSTDQYASQLDATINTLYRRLAENSKLLAAQSGSYAGFANLPTGRSRALVLEARAYDHPPLAYQLLLPYRWQAGELYVYPLVSNQTDWLTPDPMAQRWLQMVYQTLRNHTDITVRTLWQSRFIADMAKRPPQGRREAKPEALASHITLPLLTGQIIAALAKPTPAQPIASTSQTTMPPLTSVANAPTPPKPPTAVLSQDLQQQLAADRARLQRELTTDADDKMHKLWLFVAAMLALVAVLWLVVKLWLRH